MDNETKQMFELMLKKFDELGSEITGLRNEFGNEIKSLKAQGEHNQLEIKNLKLQIENNHVETKTELFKIHQKLDTIVNQVAKSAEDITALRLDMDKEPLNN